MGQPQSALEDALAFTRLLGYSNPQQTIAIGLNAAFRETRRDQADEIIEYVLTLSESVDVVLGGSEIDRECVFCTTTTAIFSHRVLRIRATTPVMITPLRRSSTWLGRTDLLSRYFRTVGETESGHMAYSALQSAFSQYDRTTVSRRLNEKLIEYGLCEKYGARGNLRIEILDKGALYPRRISQRERATKGPSGLRYEHPKTKPQYPCNHGPPSGREGGRPPTDRPPKVRRRRRRTDGFALPGITVDYLRTQRRSQRRRHRRRKALV